MSLKLNYDDLRKMSHTGTDPKVAFNRGKFAEDYQDFDGAIEDYSNAIKYDPNYLEAYLSRAKCYLQVKKFDKAIEDYETLSDLGADQDTIKSKIGNVYREIGNLTTALKYHDESVKINSRNAENYFDRALTKLKGSKIEGALFDFEMCLQILPNHKAALQELSQLKISTEDYQGANELITRMIEISPDEGFLYFNRSIASYHSNDKINAKKDLLKAETLGVKEATELLNKFFK